MVTVNTASDFVIHSHIFVRLKFTVCQLLWWDSSTHCALIWDEHIWTFFDQGSFISSVFHYIKVVFRHDFRENSGVLGVLQRLPFICTTQQEILCSETFTTTTNPLQDSGGGGGQQQTEAGRNTFLLLQGSQDLVNSTSTSALITKSLLTCVFYE